MRASRDLGVSALRLEASLLASFASYSVLPEPQVVLQYGVPADLPPPTRGQFKLTYDAATTQRDPHDLKRMAWSAGTASFFIVPSVSCMSGREEKS